MMLAALKTVIEVTALTGVAVVLFSPFSANPTPQTSTSEPVWVMVNGQWKFADNKKKTHRTLEFITTTRAISSQAHILTKDVASLPFITTEERNQRKVSSQ